jgi:hypothetical protein
MSLFRTTDIRITDLIADYTQCTAPDHTTQTIPRLDKACACSMVFIQLPLAVYYTQSHPV